MYSLIQREINASTAAYNAANKGDANANLNVDTNLDAKSTTSGHSEEATPIDGAMQVKGPASKKIKLPAIFRDPGFNLLGTSVLSTSNCGNPALRVSGRVSVLGWRRGCEPVWLMVFGRRETLGC
jgi:hypothetical protein